jgi:hypothetical protein
MLGCTEIALVFFNAIRGVTVNNKMTLSLKGTVYSTTWVCLLRSLREKGKLSGGGNFRYVSSG